MHYVPDALPFAPRPIPGELRTGWLHRLAAANGITFRELLAAWATRLPADVPAQVWVDDTLPSTVCAQLAAWCRLDPSAPRMLDVSRLYPLAGADVWMFHPDTWWHARPLTLDPSLRVVFCARWRENEDEQPWDRINTNGECTMAAKAEDLDEACPVFFVAVTRQTRRHRARQKLRFFRR